jgi:hypothetical protein
MIRHAIPTTLSRCRNDDRTGGLAGDDSGGAVLVKVEGGVAAPLVPACDEGDGDIAQGHGALDAFDEVEARLMGIQHLRWRLRFALIPAET